MICTHTYTQNTHVISHKHLNISSTHQRIYIHMLTQIYIPISTQNKNINMICMRKTHTHTHTRESACYTHTYTQLNHTHASTYTDIYIHTKHTHAFLQTHQHITHSKSVPTYRYTHTYIHTYIHTHTQNTHMISRKHIRIRFKQHGNRLFPTIQNRQHQRSLFA
jgi:hypothetical protein